MIASKPIGIFDSGIGGLTIASAIHKRFPGEKIIYFGDTAHLPYGDKSGDAIRYFCLKISKFLLDLDCKMIVIACNSAASAAHDVLLDFFKDQVLFVTVVDPLVEEVISRGYKNVGLIATKATVSSGVYPKKINAKNKSVVINQLATPLLVPMIEEGYYSHQISNSVITEYLSNPRFDNIDAMLLACTHYPLIKSEISHFFNGQVDVLDSIDVVVNKVHEKLSNNKLLNPATTNEPTFYVSDYTTSFEETTRVFYDKKVALIEKQIW